MFALFNELSRPVSFDYWIPAARIKLILVLVPTLEMRSLEDYKKIYILRVKNTAGPYHVSTLATLFLMYLPTLS